MFMESETHPVSGFRRHIALKQVFRGNAVQNVGFDCFGRAGVGDFDPVFAFAQFLEDF